ncbi:1,3-beta-glucanosyltransferase [Saxophila tyrrhenica]|uniref:1,3-beta-glucanosyltransferase n=1 Tax=Saxophila tyrrhenica TaxID=1690608 RepID=A0AAV9P5K5_9PEZI|nr:1,3-beta-glucanosyltransferase [Saxophila tyrrhenica]
MEPIHTKGNHFYRGNSRFLIKGISYIPRHIDPENHRSIYSSDTIVDALADDRLEELKRDIPIFQELGLNTIQVTGLDPTRSHAKAMHLLAEAGIYVLVEIGHKIKTPAASHAGRRMDPNFDTSRYYTLFVMRRAFRIVDQLADHPNLLAFTADAEMITSPDMTKMAEVCRAAVRDVKTLLQLRGGRRPPVGVHTSDIAGLEMSMLQYFTAGPAESRVDFFAKDCYSWASPSDFQMSGWSSMVEAYGRFPVPMFLAEFGTNINERKWDEIPCLYSPDMTGVYSGGCVYTYFEHGNQYGIAEIGEGFSVGEDGETIGIGERGERVKKEEFGRLKEGLRMVGERTSEQLFTEEVKDYEGWTGTFPAVQGSWHATANLPDLPASVEAMYEEIWKEREEQVRGGVQQLGIENS